MKDKIGKILIALAVFAVTVIVCMALGLNSSGLG